MKTSAQVGYVVVDASCSDTCVLLTRAMAAAPDAAAQAQRGAPRPARAAAAHAPPKLDGPCRL